MRPDSRSRPLVLVVDDDEAVRWVVAQGLEALGYDALAVAGAEEAILLLGDPRIAVVLTDIRMPGASGIVLLDAVRLRRGDLPAIAMTGDATPAERTAVRSRGASLLEKPFALSELDAAVAAALAGADS
jgi:DNA-binding NtrC family response regulator